MKSIVPDQQKMEALRIKLSIPREAFVIIQNHTATVVAQLLARGIALTPKETNVLAHKLAIFIRANHLYQPFITADAIERHRSALQTKDAPTLHAIISAYITANGNAREQIWKHLTDANHTPTIAEVALDDGRMYLSRLFSRNHFMSNSDALNHCLGKQSLERYFSKSRARTLHIYSVQDASTNTPYATIIYDADKGSIAQIKKLNDEHVNGGESFFTALTDALRHLITVPSIDEIGVINIRRIDQVNDLENVKANGTPIVILNDGVIMNQSEAIGTRRRDIIGGSTYEIQPQTSQETIDWVMQRTPLAVNTTEATPQQRNSMTHVTGSLIDTRIIIDDYINLKSVKGQIIVNQAHSINLHSLHTIGRGLYAKLALRVSAPNLHTIIGRLAAPKAHELNAPQLHTVHGHIDLSCVNELHLPNLRSIGWHITATAARAIHLPSLHDAGGNIIAPNATIITTKA